MTNPSGRPMVMGNAGGVSRVVPRTGRDRARERTFLEAAARGHEPFVAHAVERLEAGEEPFGDSWQWIGIRRHLRELLEEAADLGAWAVLAEQVLDAEPALTAVDRGRTRAVLRLAARRGAEAHEALTGALRALDGPAGWETASQDRANGREHSCP